MGYTHAASGLCAAAGTVAVMSWTGIDLLGGAGHQVGFLAITAGAALLPDLDHHNATATRMWGTMLWPMHKAIRWAGRGHRGGSHDPVVAPVVAWLVTWLCTLHPVTAALMLLVLAAVAAQGVGLTIPGAKRTGKKVGRVLSAVAVLVLMAALVPSDGVLEPVREWVAGLTWLPWSVALGVLVHIGGDAVTNQGVPAPFSWITGKPRTGRGPLDTGEWYERWLIAPSFTFGAVAFLYFQGG